MLNNKINQMTQAIILIQPVFQRETQKKSLKCTNPLVLFYTSIYIL